MSFIRDLCIRQEPGSVAVSFTIPSGKRVTHLLDEVGLVSQGESCIILDIYISNPYNANEFSLTAHSPTARLTLF